MSELSAYSGPQGQGSRTPGFKLLNLGLTRSPPSDNSYMLLRKYYEYTDNIRDNKV